MSFLYKATPLIRVATRPSPRLFSTTVIFQKSATDTVKDGLKQADRTVSDAAVAGIDKGVELKDKAAEASGMSTEQMKGEVKGKAAEAKGKAEELKGEAKGKAEEVKGKMS